MTAKKRYFVTGYSVWDSYDNNKRVDIRSEQACALLNKLNDEIEELKSVIVQLEKDFDSCSHNWALMYDEAKEKVEELRELKQELKKKYFKKEKMLKFVDDYLLEYDGDYFDLHKPSDIRSLVRLFNRSNGFSELECKYKEGMMSDD